MGEVYRARDKRLKRDVALKVLPQSFITDPDRVARFQREAEVLAALNHPHIAQIHGIEDSGPVRALVLEYVDGLTLANRIAQGPLALEEVLPIARQIAQALEAAHDCGIVHRDLKPANIKLRPDGTVKVLDFGLAKAVGHDAEVPGLSDSPTVTAPGTGAGIVLGTAAYMSPEQAKGRAVDRRTDIWAFGAVLYELLTGRAVFQGNSFAETVSQILTHAPNWELLPAATPPSIRTLLRRCLEKNPTRRLDSAAAVWLEIDELLTSPAPMTTAGERERPRRVTREAIIALATGSLIAALGTWFLIPNGPQQAAAPVRLTITFPPAEPLELSFRGRDIALSRDGRYLAYQSRNRLMIRALDQLDAVPLSGVTSGRTPFFSPDSRWIGFFDGGDLKKVAVTGEPVITLARNLGNPQGGTWGDDGTIVVSSGDGNVGLMRVSANGGEATALTKTSASHNGHYNPSMLPGGRGVLFTIGANAPEERQLAVLDMKTGQQKTLLRGGVAVEYVDTGHLVYATAVDQGFGRPMSGTLLAAAFDLDKLALRGEPVRVSETLQIDILAAPNYAISSTGTLVYLAARANTRSFVWVNRHGHETPITGLPPRAYQTIALSPDGTRLAFVIEDREFDVWVWDFSREVLSRVTSGPSSDYLPRWTPDGQRLIFLSDRDGPYNLYGVPSDGAGRVERLTISNNDQYPNSVTPDGLWVLTCELRPKTGFDIVRYPAVAAPERSGNTLTPTASAETGLVSTPAAEYSANISPDGRYFAYQSTESGRFAIYVRPYADVSQGRWRVSVEGGTAPVWARRGGELFYLDESNTLMAVPVETSGARFTFGKPAKVFETTYSGDFYSYDVSPDGQRFLMMKQSEPGDRNRLTSVVVVLNWLEELKQRVPAS